LAGDLTGRGCAHRDQDSAARQAAHAHREIGLAGGVKPLHRGLVRGEEGVDVALGIVAAGDADQFAAV